ncbi:hypothetical protein PGIGA_G00151230 [Pangasianodon gigas]|uniref:Uncharacterized protein n=1 Tax=Pangasianodon gigas TaxID=30993 RepID=A0ACC5XNW9_PANGG|nr:hypothetical protein [Pangasianodon gigas]
MVLNPERIPENWEYVVDGTPVHLTRSHVREIYSSQFSELHVFRDGRKAWRR